MKGFALVLLYLAAVNPPRLWPAVPTGGRGHRVAAAAVAATIGIAVVVASVAVADPVAEELEVGPEMLRIAAGGVLLLTAGRALVAPAARREPAVLGWRAGVVPLAVPLLVGPELCLLAAAAATDPGVGETMAAVAAVPALLVLVAVAGIDDRPVTGALAAGGARLLAGLLVVLAVALTIDGIRAV